MSGRTLTASIDTELGQSTTAPRWLAKLEFDGGDVRLWNGLGDLNSGTFDGAEIITNGTFDADITGWTDNDVGVATWVVGRLRLDRPTTGSTMGKDLQRQTLTTIVGRSYRVTATIRYVTADNTNSTTFAVIGINGVELATASDRAALGFDVDEIITFDFVAATTTPYMNLGVRFVSAGDHRASFDNVSIIEDEVFTGAGRLVSIEPIKETQETVASGVRMSLSIQPTSDQPDAVDAILNIALGEEYQGRPVTIWQAQIDHTDGTLISDPFIRFRGKMDVMQDSELPGSALITITAENRLIDLERSRRDTYTPESQKASHAGDTFFDEVAALQNREIDLAGGT